MLCGTVLAALCLMAPGVTDGDTFHAETPWGRQGFRLWGVSSDELWLEDAQGHYVKGPDGRRVPDPEGMAARDHLERLTQGQALACNIAGPPTFARLVVDCVRVSDGVNLACEQVKTGHAVDWPTYSRGAFERCVE